MKGPVCCPACGLRAADTGRGSQPRWRCSDPRCPFQVGWRLEFAHPDNVSQDIVAVPVGAELTEAVPWPKS